jgi:hypothetical protein
MLKGQEVREEPSQRRRILLTTACGRQSGRGLARNGGCHSCQGSDDKRSCGEHLEDCCRTELASKVKIKASGAGWKRRPNRNTESGEKKSEQM